MYSISTASKCFRVSNETIRRWIIEFTAYLGNATNVEPGRNRRLSHEDMQVLALVAEFKDNGKIFSDIHAALKAGQRGEIPKIPDTPVYYQHDSLLTLNNRIEELEEAITNETIQMVQVNKELIKAEAQVETLRELLREAHAEIARLNRLLGTRAI